VLARTPLAEASASLSMLTEEFGLIRARAQGIRKPGAKLAGAVQTFAECDVILVRGKDGWRLSGANLVHNRFRDLSPDGRKRAGRIASLMLRLIHGEANDPIPFTLFAEFLEVLPTLSEAQADAAETLVALRLLTFLGLADTALPETGYAGELLEKITQERSDYIRKINRGLSASGL